MDTNSDKRRTLVDLDMVKGAQQHHPVPNSQGSALGPKTHTGDSTTPKTGSATRSGKRKAATPERDLAIKLQRKREASPGVDPGTGIKGLAMVEAANSGIRPHELVRMKHESPWIRLRKDFELKLDVFSTIAIRNDRTRDLVIVKSFSGPDAPKKVHMLQRIRHDNFIAFLDYLIYKETHYIVLEYIGISLAHFAKSSKYPTEIHLAAILGQVCLERRSFNIMLIEVDP
jgi:hypothetical protein